MDLFLPLITKLWILCPCLSYWFPELQICPTSAVLVVALEIREWAELNALISLYLSERDTWCSITMMLVVVSLHTVCIFHYKCRPIPKHGLATLVFTSYKPFLHLDLFWNLRYMYAIQISVSYHKFNNDLWHFRDHSCPCLTPGVMHNILFLCMPVSQNWHRALIESIHSKTLWDH